MTGQTREDVERLRAEAEAQSIGPRSSSLLIDTATGAGVFFGVDWDEDMVGVLERLGHDEELDVASQWGVFKQENGLVLALYLDWPALDLRKTLYFEADEWNVELEVVAQAEVLYLYPEGTTGEDKLMKSIGVDVEADLLTEVVRLRAAEEKD